METTEKSETDKSTRSINLLTDFGFKRIFGEEANRDLLIDFLNFVLNIDGSIKKLKYGNPEKQGQEIKNRKAVKRTTSLQNRIRTKRATNRAKMYC